MKPAALRITQLTKRYDGAAVFEGADLVVEAGECMALVGLNGVGKSTLLHCLLDFIQPDEGTIEIAGVPHGAPQARAALAYLPERFLIPPYLSGREFLRYAMALHGQVADEARIARQAALLSIDFLDRKAATYSRGMMQLAGLAACMVVQPNLLVLDEPMAGLDPQAAFRLHDALKAAHAEGAAILFTTHELREVEALADRVAILQSGRLRTIERTQIAGESLFVHHANQ